jgi:hypothetical protein
MLSADTQQQIESYLRRLRHGLRGMNGSEADDIVAELRSHIVEKSAAEGARVEAILAALGSPERLANEYLTDDLLARAEVSRSPWRVLEGLFRWGSLSVAGFFALLAAITGYFFGGAFLLCALLKPFHPQSAGLWAFHTGAGDVEYSLHLGFANPPDGGRELLGWWIIPIGLALGGGFVLLTSYFALWFARRFRPSLAGRSGL